MKKLVSCFRDNVRNCPTVNDHNVAKYASRKIKMRISCELRSWERLSKQPTPINAAKPSCSKDKIKIKQYTQLLRFPAVLMPVFLGFYSKDEYLENYTKLIKADLLILADFVAIGRSVIVRWPDYFHSLFQTP